MHTPPLSALEEAGLRRPLRRKHPAITRSLLGALLLAGSLSVVLTAPAPVLAHQPVIVDEELTEVGDPEISKAYYGLLSGEPDRYRIESVVEFDLYVGILVPDDGSPEQDVRAEIFYGAELLATIGGVDATWTSFYEPFGQNTYYEGGEFRLRAPPGVYTVTVSSVDNTSAYSLAIGEIEAFDLPAIITTFGVMPLLEQEFFGVSALDFARSGFGLLSLAVIYVAALVVALLYRALLRRQLIRLIGGHPWQVSRFLRGVTALLLVGVALSSVWNPPLLFISGLLLFDALLSAREAARAARSASLPRR